MIGWQIGLAGAGAALVIGFGGGYGLRDLKADAEAGKVAEARIASLEASSAAVAKQTLDTYRAGQESGKAMAGIREFTRTIQEKVPVYVTPETDAAYPVPVGWVRVHDDAATGKLSAPSAEPYDAPSGIAASRTASVVAENYGICRENARQLTDLQAWLNSVTGALR